MESHLNILGYFNITGMELRSYLTASVGAIGLIWYYVCLIDLGLRPTAKDSQASGFRQFQALSITTISVSLATYVGYVVGIPLNSNTPSAAMTPAITVTTLQTLSAVMYVLSLVLAVWFYSQKKDQTEPAVTGLAKSLLGFVAGIFAVGLNTGA